MNNITQTEYKLILKALKYLFNYHRDALSDSEVRILDLIETKILDRVKD